MHRFPQVRLLKAAPSLAILKEQVEDEIYECPVLLVQILRELWAVAFPNGELIEGVQIRRVGHMFRFEKTL